MCGRFNFDDGSGTGERYSVHCEAVIKGEKIFLILESSEVVSESAVTMMAAIGVHRAGD